MTYYLLNIHIAPFVCVCLCTEQQRNSEEVKKENNCGVEEEKKLMFIKRFFCVL